MSRLTAAQRLSARPRWQLAVEERVHNNTDGFVTVPDSASEMSAQLPRYYGKWWDPHCEGADALIPDWRGEVNWINPPWGVLDEVAHKLREEALGARLWPCTNGQSWSRELEALADEVVVLPRRLGPVCSQQRLGESDALGLGLSSWDAVMLNVPGFPCS
eukprot:gene16963-biopygen17505